MCSWWDSTAGWKKTQQKQVSSALVSYPYSDIIRVGVGFLGGTFIGRLKIASVLLRTPMQCPYHFCLLAFKSKIICYSPSDCTHARITMQCNADLLSPGQPFLPENLVANSEYYISFLNQTRSTIVDSWYVSLSFHQKFIISVLFSIFIKQKGTRTPAKEVQNLFRLKWPLNEFLLRS